MRRNPLVLTVLLAPLLLLAACGGDTGGGSGVAAPPAIAGTWALDVDAFIGSMREAVDKAAEDGGEEAQMAKMMFEGMSEMFKQSKMDLVIKDDGTWTMDVMMGPEPDQASGTWKLSGDQVTFVGKGKKDDEEQELVGTIVNPDEIHMRPPEEDRSEMPPGMKDMVFVLKRTK